jgi:hypothetical protein
VIDGRDDLVATIAALSDRGDYDIVLEELLDDLEDELADIAEALEDDELSDDAKAALQAAATKLEATTAAVEALAPTATVADEEGEGEGRRRGDCPEREDDEAAAPSGRFGGPERV